MRVFVLLALVLSAFVCGVAAWTKEDHEIFRLNDEVAKYEGANVTFYDFIGCKPSANLDQVNKAYRKKSKQLHPDKARQTFIAGYALRSDKGKKNKKAGVRVNKRPSEKEINAFTKKASERFARLGIVANILRGPERDRYDHFLKNGFPTWRGTGYYYQRFRPGLGSVLLGLFMFGGGAMHYIALYFGWKQQRDFAERYIRNARRMAWGDESGIQGIAGIDSGPAQESVASLEQDDWEQVEDSGPMNRRQKRQQEKEAKKSKHAKAARAARRTGISTPVEAAITSGPVGAKKRVVAENGKVLIVDSVGNVYLEEDADDGTTQEFLIDPNEVPKPKFTDTFLYRLPRWAWRRSVGRATGSYPGPLDELPDEDLTRADADSDEDAGAKALRSATAINANAEARKRRAKR